MKFTTTLPSWAAPPRTQTDCTNGKGPHGQVEVHVVFALSNCTLKLSNVLVKPFVINTRFNVPLPSNSGTKRTSHSHDHVNQHEPVDVLRNLDGMRVCRGVHSTQFTTQLQQTKSTFTTSARSSKSKAVRFTSTSLVVVCTDRHREKTTGLSSSGVTRTNIRSEIHSVPEFILMATARATGRPVVSDTRACEQWNWDNTIMKWKESTIAELSVSATILVGMYLPVQKNFLLVAHIDVHVHRGPSLLPITDSKH